MLLLQPKNIMQKAKEKKTKSFVTLLHRCSMLSYVTNSLIFYIEEQLYIFFDGLALACSLKASLLSSQIYEDAWRQLSRCNQNVLTQLWNVSTTNTSLKIHGSWWMHRRLIPAIGNAILYFQLPLCWRKFSRLWSLNHSHSVLLILGKVFTSLPWTIH